MLPPSFAISSHICRRLFSAHRRDSSIRSGVTDFTPALLQLARRLDLHPVSKRVFRNAQLAGRHHHSLDILAPCTAASLNSAVYACFGTLNMPDFPPFRRIY